MLFRSLELAYIYYMITNGLTSLANMVTLGTHEQGMAFDESQGIYVVQQGDNSMLMLLYGVAAGILWPGADGFPHRCRV